MATADEIQPQVLSSSQRHLWRQVEPGLWTIDSHHDDPDPGLSVVRTLLDQPRWLEPRHLYDERGSQLFERICELPEYYLTRTESSILAEQAARVIAMAPVECLVELGAGSAKKTVLLLNEQVRQRRGGIFAPIDVSRASLSLSREIIRAQFPRLAFQGLHARYEEGIAAVEKSTPTLFVFLGSTVGNFAPAQFIRFFHHLAQCMG
ncbi:MAG: L-histidine N(alpha)-methyltransferase, partial [Candidatus Binatia bacterium]